MNKLLKTSFAALVAFSAATSAFAQDKQNYYIIGHGSETDAFWVSWLKGAETACQAVNADCNISFHNGDVALQKEALNAAIAAGADGIATTSAEPGLWNDEVSAAHAAGIPVVFFNSDDPNSGRDAYVGADLRQAGVIWAQYLVDNNLVKEGDKVFLPVEVAGATYQVQETQGIASVFDPLKISYDVVELGSDPAQALARMAEYLTANQNVAAIIGLGDLVMTTVPKAFDQMAFQPGQIPVVGWGNTKETAQAVQDGYINAGLWQYPEHQGYLPVSLLSLANQGGGIGFDITTLASYDKANVDTYLKQMQ